METNAKITLSEEERILVQDTEWILTKRSILEKVSLILAGQTELIRKAFEGKTTIPSHIWDLPPKISKGEQYHGLPYQILDFPRYFKPDETFAIRTFFWWGHYFSVTLQTSGAMNALLIQNLKKREKPFPEDLLFYTGDDPWMHDLSSPDYILPGTDPASMAPLPIDRSFYKLAIRVEWNDWDQIPEKLFKAYRLLSDFTD